MTCSHRETEVVRNTITDAAVSELCVDCLVELPLGWSCPDCARTDIVLANMGEPIKIMFTPCEAHR